MDAPGPEPAAQSPSPQAESTETARQSQSPLLPPLQQSPPLPPQTETEGMASQTRSQTPLQHETGTAGQPQLPPPPQPPQPETTETTGQPQPQAPPIPRPETSQTAGESQPPPPPPETEIKETANQPQPKQSIWKKAKVSKIRGLFRATGLLLAEWFTRRGWNTKNHPTAPQEQDKKFPANARKKSLPHGEPLPSSPGKDGTGGPLDKQTEKGEEKEKEKEKKKEETPHWKWSRTEANLEDILEKAFKNLLEHEYKSLNSKDQNCLLRFAVFPLGYKVKKQAMTYWWMAEMNLEEKEEQGKKKLTAEKEFTDLACAGFIEPERNSCTGTIHGCTVNPMVHWMVKYMAKEEVFADLDDHGSPYTDQPKSKLLCLTEESRTPLDNIKEEEDFKSQEKAASSRSVHAIGDVVCSNLEQLERKKVLFNVSVNKRMYSLPAAWLSHLFNLVVLQLGRWNSEEKMYIEVEGLKTLHGIGALKQLKYLGLRGLSRLTKLPDEVGKLKKLIILDMRGCQHLVTVVPQVMSLARLTHLDLTECYLLEHIARGVSSLTELQVFKGFVFGASQQRGRCTLNELQKLKKLRKLSINITGDAEITNGEMKQLKEFTRLRSLTITWGEIPIILKYNDKKKCEHCNRWTTLELPLELEKLDLRCYPDEKAPDFLNDHRKLKKLYVRGGELKNLDVKGANIIERLRLRHLYNFEMKWKDLLEKFKSLRFIEIMVKKEPLDNELDKVATAKAEKKIEKGKQMMIRLEVPESALDENGVWVKDEPIPAKPPAAADREQSNNGGTSGSTNIDVHQKVKGDVSGDGDTAKLTEEETQREQSDATRAAGESTKEKETIPSAKGTSSGTIVDTLEKSKEDTSGDDYADKATEEETQREQTDITRAIKELAKKKETILNAKGISSSAIADAFERGKGDTSDDGDVGKATEEKTQREQTDVVRAVDESTKEKETIPSVKGNSSGVIANALAKGKGDASGNGVASKTTEEETQREQTDAARADSELVKEKEAILSAKDTARVVDESAKEKETILNSKGISNGATADALEKGKGDTGGNGDASKATEEETPREQTGPEQGISPEDDKPKDEPPTEEEEEEEEEAAAAAGDGDTSAAGTKPLLLSSLPPKHPNAPAEEAPIAGDVKEDIPDKTVASSSSPVESSLALPPPTLVQEEEEDKDSDGSDTAIQKKQKADEHDTDESTDNSDEESHHEPPMHTSLPSQTDDSK